jgi:hypothetical protein
VWLGILTACSDYQFASREDAIPDDDAVGGDQTNVGGDDTTGGNDGSNGSGVSGDGGNGKQDRRCVGSAAPAARPPRRQRAWGRQRHDTGRRHARRHRRGTTIRGEWTIRTIRESTAGTSTWTPPAPSRSSRTERPTDTCTSNDDKYDVTGIDAFALLDGALDPIV